MTAGDARSADPLALRAAVVNWLLDFAEAEDLPRIEPGADMGALERARYERRLGLVAGALSLGRFAGDFAGEATEKIAERLLDEAYLGTIIRAPSAPGSKVVDDAKDETPDLAARFRQVLEAIDLSAGEVLMLTGSPDVGLAFSRWGVYVPELRRQPGTTDFTRFGLAIVGRGQAGHKVFEPWTQLIKSYQKHRGPTLLTSPSSNVSGILDFLWNQRESIRRYVELWRTRSG